MEIWGKCCWSFDVLVIITGKVIQLGCLEHVKSSAECDFHKIHSTLLFCFQFDFRQIIFDDFPSLPLQIP